MKKNMLLISLFMVSLYHAQIIIDPNGQTEVSSPSVALEFGNAVPGGVVVPYVSAVTANEKGAEEGTLIIDPTDRKVKIKNVQGGWNDLSGGASTANPIPVPPTTGLDDDTNAKVVIGNNASQVATKGVMVLSDSNKAMVLPKMDSPHLNIVNPAPGMIVYDTYDKQLAIFNGTQWSFWK